MKREELCFSWENSLWRDMKRLRGKRAQFFLVAAFIMALIIVGISRINNYITVPSQPFLREEVNRVLDKEAQVTVNYALTTMKDTHAVMEDFSKSYAAYARSNIPRSQYFFLYTDDQKITLFAFGNPGEIGATMGPGKEFLFSSGGGDFFTASRTRGSGENQANVTFYGNDYVYNLEEIDFKHIVRAEDEDGIFLSAS